MVIGEAPGKREVEEGRPFVGKSGELLGKALSELGLEREDIYVTNVVKFHPKNRLGQTIPPTLNECSEAYAELYKELQDTDPQKVLLLGKTAQDWSPLDLFQEPQAKTVKAWHPSYVLRRGGYGSETYKQWLEQLRPFK